MADRVSKDWSASAFSKVWSRECFIEVYIDNQCKIIIVSLILKDTIHEKIFYKIELYPCSKIKAIVDKSYFLG